MSEILNMFDLTKLIEALLELAFFAITVLLIPWLKTKLDNEQEAKLRTAFEIAVLAAEKLYGAGNGDKKLEYVEGYLKERGIKVDTARIKAYVNAEIRKMEQAATGGVTIIEQIGEAVLEEETEDEEPQEESITPEV